MNAMIRRTLRALALGLVVVGWAASDAKAASLTGTDPVKYQTVGSVGNPTTGAAGMVYYTGVINGSYDGSGSIDLGNFVVSTLAKSAGASYVDTPFQIIASVGSDASEKISGVINGQVGPNITDPSLTATITSISQYGNNPLPFTLNLPMNTPLKLALPDGGAFPSPTSLASAVDAAPIPEPTSVAVFAVAMGGLGLWRRRAAR